MLFVVYVVLSLLLIAGDGANILSVLPSSSKSHFIYPHALLQELAANGHKVSESRYKEVIFIVLLTLYRFR